jgi:hypothetical protein
VQIDESPSKSNHKSELTIQGLYPELDEKQLREAEQNLHAYFGVVWRIYRRLNREKSKPFDTRSERL